MKIDPIIRIVDEVVGPSYLYRRANGTFRYIDESEKFVKGLSFSLSRDKDSEIIGMVAICPKTLYPTIGEVITLENFEFKSVVQSQFQDFARGEWKSAPPKRPAFRLSEIESGERRQEFVEVVEKVFADLNRVVGEESFISLIEERPRYLYRHKFIIRWHLAVWRGKVDPEDQEELARRDAAVRAYNEIVKRFGDTDVVTYTPGEGKLAL